ncbi:microcystin degradation protein MlrC [Rhodoligotrophos appendicifer]|uniref:M81 family metallopeptidase n=1 Tax=Rhodoligotrophos appendicifer TaxID=987056 RepID=UPI001184CA0D|nr:M81 family metallopeptidase [Rhodoligotrophos appendicifer]
MKIFIAGFDTETNTFAPLPTGRRGFEDGFMAHGNATSLPANYCSAQLHVWRRIGEAAGCEIVESLCTYAEPGGLIIGAVYEELRDEILRDLRAAGPVDVVLLALHGAMAAEGYDDCEGDILAKVRSIVGPAIIIGAEFDLHAHLSDRMVENADLLVGYKEYPHVDISERAEELIGLALDAALGRTTPCMAVFDCRMIGTFRTTEQPLRGFIDRIISLEGKDGILSVTLSHSFPWADNPDVGAKVLVIADGDREKAALLARSLGEEFFSMRHQIAPRFVSFDQALDEALQHPAGPVVIADVADNPGGGAPSDSTFCLERLLERGISNTACGYFWDPMAVKFCFDAGRGARFQLRLGGKCGAASGMPLDLNVIVRGLEEKPVQHFGRSPNSLGPSAWIEAEGIDIIVTSLRTQVFNPDGFQALGLDITSRKIVVVKSTQHFHAGFAPVSAKIIYAATPGALDSNFATIPYTKLNNVFWPKVEWPFSS